MLVLEEEVRAHPTNGEAHGLLIRGYGILGDLAEARSAAESYRAILPKGDPSADVELGHAYELAHAFDDALAAYDRARDLAPLSPVGPREGGIRAARWGLAEEADVRLREAVKRGARDTETLHALGLVSTNLGNHEDAEAYYRQCIKVGAAECHLGLASLGLRIANFRLALEGFDGVLRLRPTYGDAALGRSFALIKLGRSKEAEEALTHAEQLGAPKEIIAKQRTLLSAQSK